MPLLYRVCSLALLCSSAYIYTISHPKNCLLSCFAALKKNQQNSDASLDKGREQYSAPASSISSADNAGIYRDNSDGAGSPVNKHRQLSNPAILRAIDSRKVIRKQRERSIVTFASHADVFTIFYANPSQQSD